MTPSPTQRPKKAAAFMRGLMVFIVLVILTGVEFWLSVYAPLGIRGSLVFLSIIALAKAGLIAKFFMHISSLWSEEAH